MDLRSNVFFFISASESHWKSTLLVFPCFGLTAHLYSAEVSFSCKSIPRRFPEKEPNFSPVLRLIVCFGCCCHMVIFDCWMREKFSFRSNVWGLLAWRFNTNVQFMLCNISESRPKNMTHMFRLLHPFLQFLPPMNWPPFFIVPANSSLQQPEPSLTLFYNNFHCVAFKILEYKEVAQHLI